MNYTIYNFTSIMDVFLLPSQFLDNMLYDFVIMIVWLIALLAAKGAEDKALNISFFTALIPAMVLNWAGLVHTYVVGICLVGFFATLFMMNKEGGK